MSEPEDVIIDAAEHTTEAALTLWQGRSETADDQSLRLEEIKRRIELFLSATYGRSAELVVAEPPRSPSFLVRWFRDIPKFSVRSEPIASTDGRRIRLPRRLAHDDRGRSGAMARYRLYAVEQMERIRRGTAGSAPEGQRDPVRALYLLAEAAVVDAEIARKLPGLADEIRRQRRRALEERPEFDDMRSAEEQVERICRRLLRAEPDEPPDELPRAAGPRESLEWARRRAGERLEASEYRGSASVELWGEIEREHTPGPGTDEHAASREGDEEQRSTELDRRPKAREPEDDEDDDKEGSFFVPQDDLHESAQDPMGLQRPVDRDDEADPDELGESLEEMQQGRLVRTDDRAREVLSSDDPPPRSFAEVLEGEVDGIRYPEWNYKTGEYREDRVVLRPLEPDLGAEAWVAEALREKARLVRDVRRCFEQLQPRRERLRRQPDGPEIDVNAYVEAYGDRAAGCAPEERLYQAIRPRRREVAVELLVDVSASTDSWVKDDKRVIDVEKTALLVVCEALEALGDRYAISAFSGRGPREVMSWRLKDYDERYDTTVKRRIAGLGPRRYTRTGAAIRHSTARLDEESVRHPLLLILSDGKPNDFDEYETRYGVEDTRQAVHEARLQGIEVFCLTIDHDAPSYMNRIFGTGSFGVLRQPELLPRVLVDVVRTLLDR